MRAVSIVTSHIMSLIKSGDACDDASQPATYSKREISIHFHVFLDDDGEIAAKFYRFLVGILKQLLAPRRVTFLLGKHF